MVCPSDRRPGEQGLFNTGKAAAYRRCGLRRRTECGSPNPPDSNLFARPISFDGIGEPIEKLADGIERAYTRKERKRSVELYNEAKQTSVERDRVALERERMELDRDRQRDAIATDMQRYEAFRSIFLDLHGPDALASDDGRRLFAQFLSDQAVLEGLDNKGMISLSRTTAAPANPPPEPT
jgi:hypothetical protein